MRISALSDVGLVRKNNEDNFFICAPHLFIVADGMGGHEAGEVASKIAVTAMQEYMTKNVGNRNIKQRLREAVRVANREVYQEAAARHECFGMGTTISAVFLQEDMLYWVQVGDSRVYLVREGTIQLLTEDHSLVWQLLKQGSITLEEANVHPQRNVLTRAVGTEPETEIDVGEIMLLPKDQILLCTDGLSNLVSGEEITETIVGTTDPDEAVKKLVQLAKEHGGFDNITTILIDNR
jgi:PPM family protein phosphatase